MLPGTFTYVYLGHIGAEGLRSAASVERGKTPRERALLAVGLLATVAVWITPDPSPLRLSVLRHCSRSSCTPAVFATSAAA